MFKRTFNWVFPGIILLTVGCIEGPTVEQDSNFTIPDGKALVIIRHFWFLDRTAEQRGMTIEEYKDYLISVFGETRNIRVARSNGSFNTPTLIGEYEIDTIAKEYSGVDCTTIQGAAVRLNPGEYIIYDNEVSGEPIRSFFIDSNDYLGDCKVESISHSF